MDTEYVIIEKCKLKFKSKVALISSIGVFISVVCTSFALGMMITYDKAFRRAAELQDKNAQLLKDLDMLRKNTLIMANNVGNIANTVIAQGQYFAEQNPIKVRKKYEYPKYGFELAWSEKRSEER